MQKILNKKSSIAIENDQKRIENFYNALTNDANSIFYATSQITKNLIRKAKNSIYEKDKVFFNMYDNLDKENKKIESLLEKSPLTRQFIEKSDVDRSTLYSFDDPFQLLQADIAYISFLAKSAIDPKFCLLFVDLFTSKIYTFPMKTRNLLAKKMEQFYNDIQKEKKKKKWPENEIAN